jgi:subtilase family serine protease
MNTQPAYSHRKFFRATAICMLFPLVALASAAPLTSKASAQNVALAGPVARIPAAISDDHEVKLEGTLHPLAQARFDSGAMEALKPLHGITMVFSRSPQQQADLNALNTAQENPSSALYHKWLTPEQFAARFGMAATDLEKASAWLEHQGFTIDRLSRSRDRIFFSGNAGQVNRAFATELHYYTVKGQKHFAPSRALSVPSSLAEVVLTIGNLDNFQPHPMHRFVRQEEPNFTSGTSGSHYVSPGDIATIYDINPSYQAGINGTGQSITILGQSYIYLSDIEHFQSASGLAIKDPEMVLVPGTGPDGIATPDNEAESDLDLEWSGSVAPGAEVFFVYTGDGDPGGVFDSLQYAVDNRISPIISLSYGSCEGVINSSGILQALEELAQQGVTQGQTLIASSGDDGASACFYDTDLSLAQRTALSVAYPASSAFFTAVGGTMFNEGSGSYWQSTPGTDIISSATSYIPEIAWNEDYVYEGIGYLGSTTGGASILFAKPSWQTGIPGIPADNARDVPDVALDSAGSCSAAVTRPSGRKASNQAAQMAFEIARRAYSRKRGAPASPRLSSPA